MESVFSEYLTSIISLSCLQMIALASPGPDFAVIVRNSLVYSRRTALLTALGITLGILVHVSYCLLGVGLVITKTPWLFKGFRYVGATYLFYIGCKSLLAKKGSLNPGSPDLRKDISPRAAVMSGFLTNATNPKVMLFFLSLFSMIVDPKTPALILGTYAVIIFATTWAWFSFVALCLSGERMRKAFGSVGHWIERTTGALLVFIAIRLLAV